MSAQSTDPTTPPRHVPQVSVRNALRYAGIHMRLAPEAVTTGIDDGFSELFAWLAARGLEPAGAPLIRYHAMARAGDGGALLDLDLGVPISAGAEAAGWVHVGELPAGRWVSMLHEGSFEGMKAATAALGAWSRRQGLVQATDAAGRSLGWAEHYCTDPRAETDRGTWRTEIAVLVH